MKKKSMEEHILLAQSGELKGRRARRLAHDIEKVPGQMAYRADLEQLSALVRDHPPSGEVSDLTLRRIRAAADQAVRPTRREMAPMAWQPILAYAAAALLLLGGGLLAIQHFQGPPIIQTVQEAPTPAVSGGVISDDELDNEIAALDEMLAMSYRVFADNGATTESDDDIAKELIELEGIEI